MNGKKHGECIYIDENREKITYIYENDICINREMNI